MRFLREKYHTQKSAYVSVLVISRGVSLKFFITSQAVNILTNFHDFTMYLKYLRFICTKCPHYCNKALKQNLSHVE